MGVRLLTPTLSAGPHGVYRSLDSATKPNDVSAIHLDNGDETVINCHNLLCGPRAVGIRQWLDG